VANLVIMSLKTVVIIKEGTAGREVLVGGTYTSYITQTQKACSPKYASIQDAKNAIVEWRWNLSRLFVSRKLSGR
jgi:hypothetical protein